MFLSTRWGKPLSEIEALPISEINRQKLFWEHCPWGMTEDILALHHSFYVGVKSGKKVMDTVEVKRLAIYTSAVKKFVIESTKVIRSAFIGIASAMKDR